MISMVGMASPGPFTRQPISPSNWMELRSFFGASTSAGSSSSRSRSCCHSGWRKAALSSKLILASSATTLPSPVRISGLISARLQSVSSKALWSPFRMTRACGTLAAGMAQFRRMHAAALAAAACVDLRLYDPHLAAQLARRFHGLVDGKAGEAARRRDSVFPEDLLGLVFVDLHACFSTPIRRTDCSAAPQGAH